MSGNRKMGVKERGSKSGTNQNLTVDLLSKRNPNWTKTGKVRVGWFIPGWFMPGWLCGLVEGKVTPVCLNFGFKIYPPFLTSTPNFIKIRPNLAKLASELVSAR